MTVQVNGHAPAAPEMPGLGPALAWPRQETAPDAGPDRLRTWCTAALWAIAALIAAASAASFAESYRGLWLWARRHGFSGFWAAAFPAQVDVFIAVGELTLFVAMVLAWRRRSRAAAWTVTLAGLAVSVAGNVGHVAGGGIASRVTAAVPPVAATVALAVGLGVLKRLVQGDSDEGKMADKETDRKPPQIAKPQVTDAPAADKAPDKKPPRQRQPRQSERAAAILRRHWDWKDDKVAQQADCHVRTVQRARAAIGKERS